MLQWSMKSSQQSIFRIRIRLVATSALAKTARYNSLKQAIPPVVYIPFSQRVDGVSFEVRTHSDPLGLIATVRQIIRQVDSRVPVSDVNTQSRQVDQTINQE